MAKQAALHDPEVLLEFRRTLIDCLARAQRALEGAASDIQRTETWLKDDRAPTCKRTALRNEERMGEAKIALMEAKSQVGNQMARSHETEERDFYRARAAYEASAAKMQKINRWLIALPREAAEPLAALRRALALIEHGGPQAVARIDEMITGIETYLAASQGRAPRPSEGA